MTHRTTSVCLALFISALAATWCAGLTGCTALGAQDTTTLAPTTTTTLSPAAATLSNMTTRQKAAQVLMVSFSGTTVTPATSALLAAGPPGGVLFLGSNVTDAAQVLALTAALQQAAAPVGLPVGLFVAVDQEGGKVQRIKQGAPALPSARTLGTKSTPDATSELARQTARALVDLGINMNLAPVADVVSDHKSFLFDRSYSGDPAVVSSYVTAVVQASQGQGIISVVKHFPGHGSASGNTHTEAAVANATTQEFDTIHLVPFRAAIAAGAEGIMVSHIVATAYDAQNPASLSQAIVTTLLRGQLGFDGLVVTDDLSMGAVLGNIGDDPLVRVAAVVKAAVTSLNAGCDLLILSELTSESSAVLDGLAAAVEQGQVSAARLDEAVLRILDLKYRHGIIAPAIPSATTTDTQAVTAP